jgi:hypothetical protein
MDMLQDRRRKNPGLIARREIQYRVRTGCDVTQPPIQWVLGAGPKRVPSKEKEAGEKLK